MSGKDAIEGIQPRKPQIESKGISNPKSVMEGVVGPIVVTQPGEGKVAGADQGSSSGRGHVV
ncbi:MAG: hypothetical protein WC527_06350 [Candidatus Margulisiibacteriota bacterium]